MQSRSIMQALLFRRFFFAVHHQEDLSFCKKEVLKKRCLKLKKRIRFAIDCKSDPFFSYARQAPVMMEITKNNRFLFHVSKHSKDMLRQDVRILRADLASTAFGKIIAVYGHIDENGPSVRKWTALKMAITDKMGKNSCLSVRFQTFRTRFYGQMLQKADFVRKSG